MLALIETKGRGALTALEIGLLLTVTAVIALIIDQTTVHRLAAHVEDLYAPHDLHPDPNVLFGYLYASGVIGIVLWLTTIWGVKHRRRGVTVGATTVFVVGGSLAIFNVFVSEYGGRIFPPLWSIVGLLPSVAGLAAVILLWTSGRAKEKS